MNNMQLEIAIRQIEFARKYMLSLIQDIPDEDWFRMPDGITHVAWQIGHVAMAQYGLCLFRLRGRRDTDLQLMSSDFRKSYSRGSTPRPDPTENPSPAEIRDVLNRVYQQAIQELGEATEEQLNQPVEEPHAVFATKLGAVFFSANHEMLHAGQVGLLRRQLGKNPIR